MLLPFNMLFGYEVNLLEQHVVSGVCLALQKILNLIRKLSANEKEVKNILDMIIQNFMLISSFDKAPKHTLRILARRETKQNVEQESLERIKNNNDVHKVDCASVDEIQKNNTWKPLTSRKLANQLNKCLNERENLMLFVGLVLSISCSSNDQFPDIKFTQGQSVMTDEIPDVFIPLKKSNHNNFSST